MTDEIVTVTTANTIGYFVIQTHFNSTMLTHNTFT